MVRAYMAEIGRLGGKTVTAKKVKALRKNLKRANQARTENARKAR